MDKYFAVIEIQVNNGVPAAPAPVFVDNVDAAIGEMYVKLGYAYQNPRDYTSVVILDEAGNNITSTMDIKNVFDNRENKEPVYTFVEIQINDGVRTAAPVNTQVGEEAQSLIMQAYHNALSYAWNVKRNYTECVVIGTNALNSRMECVDFMPAPVPNEPEAIPEEPEEEAEQ